MPILFLSNDAIDVDDDDVGIDVVVAALGVGFGMLLFLIRSSLLLFITPPEEEFAELELSILEISLEPELEPIPDPGTDPELAPIVFSIVMDRLEAQDDAQLPASFSLEVEFFMGESLLKFVAAAAAMFFFSVTHNTS